MSITGLVNLVMWVLVTAPFLYLSYRLGFRRGFQHSGEIINEALDNLKILSLENIED